MCLLKNFAMPFSILNRVFYTSCDRMGKIVYPSGAYIGREPHSELRLPACKWTYDRQIDELQQPFSDLDIDLPEFPLFKAVLFFNRGKETSGTASVPFSLTLVISGGSRIQPEGRPVSRLK